MTEGQRTFETLGFVLRKDSDQNVQSSCETDTTIEKVFNTNIPKSIKDKTAKFSLVIDRPTYKELSTNNADSADILQIDKHSINICPSTVNDKKKSFTTGLAEQKLFDFNIGLLQIISAMLM